jgi:predicted site-specific integrase-resolvase
MSFFRQQFPDHVLVSDVASGINWKRKDLKTLLEQSLSGSISEIVVAHRDRLCRFAFELLEFIFQLNDTRLVVLDQETNQSSDRELADDILSIVHVYSCRSMGKRRYKDKKGTSLSDGSATTDIKTMDGNM